VAGRYLKRSDLEGEKSEDGQVEFSCWGFGIQECRVRMEQTVGEERKVEGRGVKVEGIGTPTESQRDLGDDCQRKREAEEEVGDEEDCPCGGGIAFA
jgi:hypothetical protein